MSGVQVSGCSIVSEKTLFESVGRANQPVLLALRRYLDQARGRIAVAIAFSGPRR